MRRAIAIASFGVVLFAAGYQQGATYQGDKAPKKGFPAVAAIFKTSCMPCHSGAKPAGKLDLTSYANAMKPAEDGVMVVPGKPDKSPLMDYLNGKKKPTMPFRQPLLSKEKQKTIRDWIAKGAKNK